MNAFRPFSIPNLAVARCDSGKALQILDTPFLQATTFEHERQTPNAKRLVRAGHSLDVFLGLKPQAQSCYPFGINPSSPYRSDLFMSRFRQRNSFAKSELL